MRLALTLLLLFVEFANARLGETLQQLSASLGDPVELRGDAKLVEARWETKQTKLHLTAIFSNGKSVAEYYSNLSEREAMGILLDQNLGVLTDRGTTTEDWVKFTNEQGVIARFSQMKKRLELESPSYILRRIRDLKALDPRNR